MATKGAYTIVGANLTVVNAIVTLIWLNPKAAVAPDFEFMRWWCGETTDVTSKATRIQIGTQPTTFPTVVSATPQLLNQSDNISQITGNTTGAVGTCDVNASAEGTGTKVVLWPDQFNNVNGWLMLPTPEERYEIAAGGASGLGLVFPVAVTPLTGWSFGTAYREI